MPEHGTTTMARIEGRKERIPWSSERPMTIRDAFFVTRALGIRYLWVDAPCIIQDSPTDWETEPVKMASIYSCGLVCIAAVMPASCADGFLHFKPEQDNPCSKHMLKISNKLRGGQNSNLYIGVRELCSCFIRDNISALKRTALSTRGWAYQERILAPRILHFAGPQIIWECRSRCGVMIEEGMLLRDMVTLHEFSPAFGRIANMALGSGPDTTQAELRRLWYGEVVTEFSKRSLTRASDKLPALAGVAGAFAMRMGRSGGSNTYAAGMWLDDIVSALSWSPRAAAERPPSYRAPSFSWASTDGVVNVQNSAEQGFSRHVKLEEYHFKLPAGAFGSVAAGWVRLAGFLGRGVIKNGYLKCSKSGVGLGHAYFDDERRMNATEGWSAIFLPVWSDSRELFFLLLKQREGEESSFERAGHTIGVQMDTSFLTKEWLGESCESTYLILF